MDDKQCGFTLILIKYCDKILLAIDISNNVHNINNNIEFLNLLIVTTTLKLYYFLTFRSLVSTQNIHNIFDTSKSDTEY